MLFKDINIVLIGQNIRITPFVMEDVRIFTKLMLGENAEIEGEAYSLDNLLKKHIDGRSDDEMHAIRLSDKQDMIGWITLQHDENGRPDIGISLVPEHRNKGYGPEAVTLFSNRLHAEYGLQRIFVRIEESNIQSISAFSKLNAVLDCKIQFKEVIDLYNESLERHTIDNDTYQRMIKEVPYLNCYHIDLPCSIAGSRR